ncbi:MAG: hypothetical protein Q7S68_04560 [Deltaproteobacteria bacterium]|nr:hypothetical protein [Deltaproteobacteria bacterium]
MEKDITEIKERLEKLEKVVFGGVANKVSAVAKIGELDFSLNQRAFIKKYSAGFNGQEFFALILAYLSGGKELAPVDLSQIKTIWKSCVGIIGAPYASTFSTRAKENGWADAAKDTRGFYVLGKHWQDIFKTHGQNS